MGVSCVYESCSNHRPQSREAQKFDPCFISWNQQSPEQSPSAAAPSLHRFLARIPEPQIRVPNSAHLLLIAGIPPFFLSLSSFREWSVWVVVRLLRQSAQRKRKDLERGWAWAEGLVRQSRRRGRERLVERLAWAVERLRQSGRRTRE